MKTIKVFTKEGVKYEKLYTIKELPYIGKLLSCKDSKKRSIHYLEIPCAFDIETTNISTPLDPQETFFDEDIYNYLKSVKIKYSEKIKNGIADFEQLRRSYFGKLKLSKGKGIPVDSLYQELSETRPDLFPYDIINPLDQLLQIMEVFDNNAPQKEEFRPYAFMYQWQFCLDDCVCFGRTWEEFQTLLSSLEKNMNLSYTNRLVVYVHNLSFEWIFMERFIDYEEGFFKEERKPLKFLTKGGIEFRDSYALSNMSLNKFCENEGAIYYKLDGEAYDYGKIRTPQTTLTEYEQSYCYNDVRGLCECIKSRMRFDTLSTIPMTSTGYVRRDLRQSVRGDKKYRELFRNNKLSLELYTLCRDAFRGGDTHANIHYSNQLLHDITSKDIASSYPASMMMNLYPMTAFMKINVSTYLNNDLSDYAKLLEVRFQNVRYVGKCGIPYIPWSKCRAITNDKVIDNGRVLYAGMLEIVITDIDLEIILNEYTFDDIFYKDIYISKYAPLSDKIKSVVMDYYRGKTELKGDSEHEYEYNRKKASLNSTYGCMVMRIDQEETIFNPVTHEYETKASDLEELLNNFYKSRNNFLSYQHGLWVTSHSRKRLRTMLNKVGSDVVYCAFSCRRSTTVAHGK